MSDLTDSIHLHRVLIVEDEPRLRDVLSRAVRDMEFPVSAVESAEQGLASMERHLSDIIVTDLNLPGMQGLELCETVHERWPDVQLIILTGYGDLDAAKRAIRLDVVDFLTKPASLAELEVAVNRAVRRRLTFLDREIRREAVTFDVEPPTDASGATLEDVERQHILDALARHDGNRQATADALGISVRTLYYRLRRYQTQGHYVPLDRD